MKDPINYCKEVLRDSKSSFGQAILFLDRQKREAMTAFYAFCRLIDDAVDAPSPDKPDLDFWKEEIIRFKEGIARHPVSKAMLMVCTRFSISHEDLMLVIDGVEMDKTKNRYENFSELYQYCYKVASSVGIVCVKILGDRSENALRYAELGGIGVQMTNILRDLKEDAERNRIYLPLEDLRLFNVPEEQILAGKKGENLTNLMMFEARRAKEFYILARSLLDEKERQRLFFAEALLDTYERLLDKMMADGMQVFDKRYALQSQEKVMIGFRHYFKYKVYRTCGLL